MAIKAILYYDSTELELSVLKKSSLTIVKELERVHGEYLVDDLSLVCSNISGELTTAFSGSGPWEVRLWKDGALKYGGDIDKPSVVFDWKAYTCKFNVFGYAIRLRDYRADEVKFSNWAEAELETYALAGTDIIEISGSLYNIIPGDRLRIHAFPDVAESADEDVLVLKVDKAVGKLVLYLYTDLEHYHPAGSEVENLSPWYRNVMLKTLVGLLFEQARVQNCAIELPERLDLGIMALSALSLSVDTGLPVSLVKKTADIFSLVAETGTWEGDFDGGFTLVSGNSHAQADWIEQGSVPDELLRRSGEASYPTYRYAYDYEESTKCRFKLKNTGSAWGLYRNDWNGSSWGSDATLKEETDEMTGDITVDATRRYVYYTLKVSSNNWQLRRYKVSDGSVSSATRGLTCIGDKKYLKNADIIVNCEAVDPINPDWTKQQIAIYAGSDMAFKHKAKVPLGLDLESLISVRGRIYGLNYVHQDNNLSKPVEATYFFSSSYSFYGQSNEKICDGGYNGQLTLHADEPFGWVDYNFFKYSRYQSLVVREADFKGQTVAVSLKALAQMSNCLLSVDCNRRGFFVDRDYYCFQVTESVDAALITKMEVKEWENVYDLVKISYQQGDVTYPSSPASGRAITIDCPFVYYESYALALAKMFYEFFKQPRRSLKATLAQSALPSVSSSSSSSSESSISSSSSSSGL